MATEGKIALFVGNDVVAHLVMNKVVDYLVDQGYEPVLFFPKNPNPPKNKPDPMAEQELKNFAFFESRLINETLYPFLTKNPMAKAQNVTPVQLAKRHDLSIRHIDSVNDPDFVAELKNDDDIIGGLSIRCKQIFKESIINTFRNFNNKDGFLINLHPGVCPFYRGLMSTGRAFFNAAQAEAGQIRVPREEMRYGWTLHHVIEGIDTGNVLQIGDLRIPVPPRKLTIWQANIDAVTRALDIVKRTMEDLQQVGRLNGYPQVIRRDEKGKDRDYYTYPTREELNEWNKTIVLYNRDEVVPALVRAFSEPSTRHEKCLTKHLKDAIAEWEKDTPMLPTGFAPGEGASYKGVQYDAPQYSTRPSSNTSPRVALA